MELLISLIAGAVGANVAASLLKNTSLGFILNSITGPIGGALGGKLLGMLGMAGANAATDFAAIIGQLAAGGIGGGLLLTAIGFLKRLMIR